MLRRSATIVLVVTMLVSAVCAADEPVRWKVEHPAYCLAVSPDGKALAVGGPEKKADPNDPKSFNQPGRLTILDAATGKARRSITTDRAAWAAAFSTDGKRLLTGTLNRGGIILAGKKGSVFPRMWDVESGKELLALDGHTDMIKGTAFLPDGKRMVTCSGDGSARVWDAASGEERLVIKTGYFNDDLALSADGKRLAVGSGNTKLTVWDTETGKEVFTLDAGYSTNHVAFAPDGSLIAACSQGVNDITLWDGKTGKKKGSIVVGFDREKKVIVAGNVTSNLIFSPDGKWLVTGNGDGIDDAKPMELTIWDVAGKKKHVGLKGHSGRIRALAFLPGGKKLVSASADGTILVWDFEKLVAGKGE